MRKYQVWKSREDVKREDSIKFNIIRVSWSSSVYYYNETLREWQILITELWLKHQLKLLDGKTTQPRNMDHVLDHYCHQSWSNITSWSKERNSFKKQLWWKQKDNSLPIPHEFREYVCPPRIQLTFRFLHLSFRCNIMSSKRADFKKFVDDPVTYATDDHMPPILRNLHFYVFLGWAFQGIGQLHSKPQRAQQS